MRIGIIGAGAAGLTAADVLRDRGYADVTVLEKNDCAGGKCSSIEHEERSFELGAGVLSGNNRTALDLAKKYGVEIQQVDFSPSLYLDAQTGLALPIPAFWQNLKLANQVFNRYRSLSKKYPMSAPGFTGMDASLAEPFESWAAKHGISHAAKQFAPFFTGYGYGFFSEIPAAYVLKYYSWDLIRAFLKKQVYKFPNGIQNLWKRVAQEHNVKYNVTIQHIERRGSIIVKTDKGDFEFDRLIITAPLDGALSYLDAREEERELFSKIEHYDYRTYACILKNFPKKSGYIPDNYTTDRIGHPVFWYQRYSDSDLYTFYVYGDWKMTDAEVQKNIEALVKPLGGRIENIHTAAHWKFFPHVSPETMRSGYFDKLEAMQGKRNTYYAGELLNFSTVGLTSDYSKKLVERFF